MLRQDTCQEKNYKDKPSPKAYPETNNLVMNFHTSLQRCGKVGDFSNTKFQTKDNRHTKKWGNMTHSKDQNKSTETMPKKGRITKQRI